MLFTYNYAKLVRVIDGDTQVVTLDFGFRVYHKVTVRLGDCDTPESRTRNLTEKKAGKLVTKYVRELYKDYPDITLLTYDLPDKYGGRVNGAVTLANKEGTKIIDIAQHMVEEKLAHYFDARNKKRKWTDDELNFIIDKLSYLN